MYICIGMNLLAFIERWPLLRGGLSSEVELCSEEICRFSLQQGTCKASLPRARKMVLWSCGCGLWPVTFLLDLATWDEVNGHCPE